MPSSPLTLCAAAVAAVRAELKTILQPADELECALDALCTEAERQWPGVQFSRQTFVSEWAVRLPQGITAETLWTVLHAADLYLAQACGRQEPSAMEHLDRTVFPRVGAAVRALTQNPTTTDEVLQKLRIHLLLPTQPGQPPRIQSYGARGSLANWMRAVAFRLVAESKSSTRELTVEHVQETLALPDPASPERVLLRAVYGPQLHDAFAQALRELPARDRNVLKLYALDHLTIQEIGRAYAVHHSSISRWLAQARSNVLERTRSILAEKGHLSTSQVESLFRLLESELDLSLGGLLSSDGSD